MGNKRKFDEDDSVEESRGETAPEATEDSAKVKAKKPLPPGYVCNACGAVDDHAIYDCTLKVSKKKKQKVSSSSAAATSANEAADSRPRSSRSAPIEDRTPNETTSEPQQPAIKTVFVSGLPFDITKDKLLKAIESISEDVCNLETRNITLLCFPDNPNRCRGIGYINCESEADFQRCLQLKGMTIGRMTISAEESKLPAKQPYSSSLPSHSAPAAATQKKKVAGGPRCYRCGQAHDPKTCTNERICYKCRGTGHLSSQCPNKANKQKA